MNSPPDGHDFNLLYTDVETALRDTVRDLLDARGDLIELIAAYDGKGTGADALWRSLAAEIGLAGLLVPEDRGGAGASAREAAVVLEELGRSVAPVPFLTSGVVATSVLLRAERDDLLGEVASGERTAALVVPFDSGPEADAPEVHLDPAGGVRGRVRNVAGALTADLLLVPVRTGDGLEVRQVCPDDPNVQVTAVISLDMTRQLADIELSGAASQRVVGGGDGQRAVREALTLGAALLASEQVGVAEWCLTTTIDYLSQRRQFGRVIAGFQAIKHRLADMWVRVESARAVARCAAAAAADNVDTSVLASVAQAYCSGATVFVAEECVQLHGAIGMTWEHPAHLYLKRAKADQLGFGSVSAHLRQLSRLVDLPVDGAGNG